MRMEKKSFEINGWMRYAVYNLLALLSMLMITEEAAVYGPDNTPIMVFQMVAIIPQAVFMVIAPFLSYVTYLESIPPKWKVMKLGIIGVLFSISMFVTIKYGTAMLSTLYGAAECKIILLPLNFYLSLVLGMTDQLRKL